MVTVAGIARTFLFSSSSSPILEKFLFALVSPSSEFRWPIFSHKSATPEVCSSVVVVYCSFRPTTVEGVAPFQSRRHLLSTTHSGVQRWDVAPGQDGTGIAS